jgi:hypothetical protein
MSGRSSLAYRPRGRWRAFLMKMFGVVRVSDVIELEAAYADVAKQTHRRGWRFGLHFGGFLVWEALNAAGRPDEDFAGRAICCWSGAPSDSASIDSERVERVVRSLGIAHRRRVRVARLPFEETELEHADTGSIPVALRVPFDADQKLIEYLRRLVILHYLRDGRGLAGTALADAANDADDEQADPQRDANGASRA